jgi:hypothetical protein
MPSTLVNIDNLLPQNWAQLMTDSNPWGSSSANFEKAKATLKNNVLFTTLKEIHVMLKKEQIMLLHGVSAYIRDFKTRKASTS